MPEPELRTRLVARSDVAGERGELVAGERWLAALLVHGLERGEDLDGPGSATS
jgi:ParB-like chromosome segregation protein Spo0J